MEADSGFAGAGMATIADLQAEYAALDARLAARGAEAVDAAGLLAFAYEYPEREAEVVIDTDEFTAVCPWTGLPDVGQLVISYVPGPQLRRA